MNQASSTDPPFYHTIAGESLPMELSTEPTDAAGEGKAHAHALHSRNMAFSSALVVEGV